MMMIMIMTIIIIIIVVVVVIVIIIIIIIVIIIRKCKSIWLCMLNATDVYSGAPACLGLLPLLVLLSFTPLSRLDMTTAEHCRPTLVLRPDAYYYAHHCTGCTPLYP